jgi:hypothetical protein
MGRAVRPQRRSIRLPSYDYAGDGWYFITICTRDKTCWLGSIVDSSMLRSAGGRVVQSIWESLPRRFPGVTLDAFVVMPNHIHGILVLESQTGAGAMGAGAVGAGAIVLTSCPGSYLRTSPVFIDGG